MIHCMQPPIFFAKYHRALAKYSRPASTPVPSAARPRPCAYDNKKRQLYLELYDGTMGERVQRRTYMYDMWIVRKKDNNR